MMRRIAGVSAFAVVALLGEAAHASPEDIFGYGGRSSALGGTGIAHARGYEAVYANPALLGGLTTRKLTLGVTGSTFSLFAREAGTTSRVTAPGAHGIVVGADVPIPFGGALKDRVGFGLAFYTPSDVIVRGRILYPETPQYPFFADRAQSVAVRVGLGADLGSGIRVGAGFAALAEIVGTVNIATDATGKVGAKVEDQLVATYAPTFGASYTRQVSKKDELVVGAVVRGKLDARFAVAVDATRLSSLNLPVFNIAGLAQYDPLQAGLEAALVRTERTLAISVTWKHWSAYPGLLEPTVRCEDGTDCGILRPPVPDMSDTVVVRVGAEQRVFKTNAVALRARGGAFLEPSPLGSKAAASDAYSRGTQAIGPVPSRTLDASRVALTWGAGVTFAKLPFDIDVFGQLHVLVPRSIDISTTSPNEVRASGHAFSFGTTVGVKL